MKIKEEYHGDIVVLDLRGDLMQFDDINVFREKTKLLASEGFKKQVYNLSHVKWMNSSGLGALMSSLVTCKNAGGDAKISNATDKINSLLMITQLTKIYHNYDSTEKAIASFQL